MQKTKNFNWFFLFFILIFFTPSSEAQTLKRKFFPEVSKIYWKGSVTLKVESFDKARDEALGLTEKYDGENYSEKIITTHNGRKHGYIVIRVPIEKRNEFIKDIYTLGTLYSQSISAPDLTEEYIDLARRLTNLKAEEEQLLEVLKQAGHVLEVLQVQAHLYNVRVEIERITSRTGEISIKSETALFTLELFEPMAIKEPVTPGGLKEFFPRWWNNSALPLIKREVKNTYYTASEKFLSYILGLRGSVPNLVFVIAFILILLIFLIFVWPLLNKNLSDALYGLKGMSIPTFKIIWTFIFIYAVYLLFSPYIAITLFLLIFYLWWLGFCKTERIKNILHYCENRGIKSEIIHFILSVPLIISIIFSIFPGTIVPLIQFTFILAPVTVIMLLVLLSSPRIRKIFDRQKVTDEKAENKEDRAKGDRVDDSNGESQEDAENVKENSDENCREEEEEKL